MVRIVTRLLLFSLLLSFSSGAEAAAPVYPAKGVKEFPHDKESYTQGLILLDGQFVESSGHYGRSWIVRYKLGEIPPKKARQALPEDIFAEGIARKENALFLLTWREGALFQLNLKDLKIRSRKGYPPSWGLKEGWGMATIGEDFAVSDGTHRVRIIDGKTFKLKKIIDVTDGQGKIELLNELEWVDGVLLANVWYSDKIAAINPMTGRVTYWIDLSALRSKLGKGAEVANGIAWDKKNKKLYVTGKNWDKLFEIALPSNHKAGMVQK